MSIPIMPNDLLGAIVVVDNDSRLLAELTQLFKRTFRHPVRSFTSATAALAWCAETVPDLIVSELSHAAIAVISEHVLRTTSPLSSCPTVTMTGV